MALVASTAAFGFAAVQPGPSQTNSVAFNFVGTAHGAAPVQTFAAVHFDLNPQTAVTEGLVPNHPLFTPEPTPTPTPTPKPTPKPTRAPVVTAVVSNGTLLWPVPGAVITQYFWSGHLAVDLAVPAGSPVLAAASGTVVWAGWRTNGGGLVVEIDHGHGLHTVYNHLGAILVGVGQTVSRGQQIAKVGCTGLCTGPHVHFQVSINGVFVNPLRYISR